MNYKEKYENALSHAKQAINNIPDKSLAKWLQSIFPELKESDDEDIRYFLIRFVKINAGVNISPDYAKKALAWLEKQGEQKHTWNEEDEKFLNLSLENLTELKNSFGEKYGKVGDCICWIQSLKDRMKGKTK